MDPHCLRRAQSTVVTQALYLLNDSMVRKLAGFLAKRVQAEAGDDPVRQVEAMYRIAIGRPPSREEMDATVIAMKRLRSVKASDPMAELCHVMFNSAAFLYVD
jgi:hypothetical protein